MLPSRVENGVGSIAVEFWRLIQDQTIRIGVVVVGRNPDPKIVAKNFIGHWGGGEAGIAVGRSEEAIEVPN